MSDIEGAITLLAGWLLGLLGRLQLEAVELNGAKAGGDERER